LQHTNARELVMRRRFLFTSIAPLLLAVPIFAQGPAVGQAMARNPPAASN
jgi:hypothetical protein